MGTAGPPLLRRVAVVTGTRAEYGILRPVLRELGAAPGTLPLVVAAGMHLLPEFGLTVRDIERDGFEVAARVHMGTQGDDPAAMATALGMGIAGMSGALQALRLDIVLVVGDRGEPFAATVAAAHLNIPVAHLHGGECTTGGNIDESLRWAITRFAHLHLAATALSAARLVESGEEPWRVTVVGAPGLDAVLGEPPLPDGELGASLAVDLNLPVLVVVQHPVTTQAAAAAGQLRETLEAVAGTGYQAVIVYPNADAGGRAMIEVLEGFRSNPRFRLHRSLPHRAFLSLLRRAAALVGNSSCGIIEAPSLGLPAVNVGIRQEGRERGANVIDVDHDRGAIAAAIRRAVTDQDFRRRVARSPNPYGDGRAARRIVARLGAVALDERLIQKRFCSQAPARRRVGGGRGCA
jgi:UDP-hydrolysing UDP-N-acetyl-D-glucosamine 2-epimerase